MKKNRLERRSKKTTKETRSSKVVSLSVEEVLKRGMAFLKGGEIKEAEYLYSAVLAHIPEQPDALHYSGMIAHKRGDNETAAALMRRSIEQMPGLAWTWNNLGNVLRAMHRDQEALSAYRKSAELDPAHVEALSNIGELLRKHGEFAAAEDACREALRLQPDFAPAWYHLSCILIEQDRVPEGLVASARAIVLLPRDGDSRDSVCKALVTLGRREEAVKLYREWLVDEPGNAVVRHHLAAISAAAPPERAADAYVQTVFDGFANTFDAKLASLKYRAPELVGTLLASRLPEPAAQYDIGDLGCGTGLCGPLVRGWARRLTGCDLSEGMLAKARQRGGYDELVHGELVAFLRGRSAAFDVVISADTLCYFGDLSEVAAMAHAALRAGGRLVFTVEAANIDVSAGYTLQTHGRYAHAADYVHTCLATAGFGVVQLVPCELRTEGGKPVGGWLVDCVK
jgi:predicted TPR repeat methyltransferase